MATNREKLFKILEQMDNTDLSNKIDFDCVECPCSEICVFYPHLTCSEILEKWLNKNK